MNLYDFILSLQKKSEPTKRKILVGLVLISFLVLSGLWVVTFKKQFGQGAGLSNTNTEKVRRSSISLAGPFASLKEGFSLVISDIMGKTSGFLLDTEDILDSENLYPETASNEERSVFELPTVE